MGVADPAVMVRVDDPVPGAAMEVGLKLAVAPVGKPDALNAIAESKLPEMAVLIVLAPDEPWVTVTDVGEAVIENDDVPDPAVNSLIKPEFGVPHPVSRSKPVTAE